jgi:hypothetical protein
MTKEREPSERESSARESSSPGLNLSDEQIELLLAAEKEGLIIYSQKWAEGEYHPTGL